MTNWLRVAAAFVVGYGIAAVANMQWVLTLHVPDRTPAALLPVTATAVMFVVSGSVAGLVARVVAGPMWRGATIALAIAIGVVAILNLALGVAAEPAWHTALALILQAPFALAAPRWWSARAGIATRDGAR